jgi:hypothetical protein
VLDRPNPINASVVQGLVTHKGLRSFAGYFPLPVRHGMTVGELAWLAGVGARRSVSGPARGSRCARRIGPLHT